MSFVSASDSGTESGGVVTWNLTNIAVGGTKTITITLQVDDVTQGDFRNWAEISDDSAGDYSTTDDDSTPNTNVGDDDTSGTGTAPDDLVDNHNDITLDNPSNDEDDNDFEDVQAEVKYDLALIKELGNGQATSVQLGDVVVYDITIANQGNVPSNTYTVMDQIPAGMSFVTASNGGTEAGGIVTWNMPNLAQGQTIILNLILRVDDATLSNYRNWAEISSDSAAGYGVTDEDSTPDGNIGDDSTSGFGNDPNDDHTNHNDITLDEPSNDEDDNDYEDIELDIEYDLALIKTLAASQSAIVLPEDIVNYEITVANQGNVPSGDYVVTDQIPAGMSFVSASDNGTETGGIVTWNLSNLPVGQNVTFSVALKVTDVTQAPFRNWAEISSDSSNDYGVNDDDSTPNTNTGDDGTAGNGTAPDDPVDNHNDITLDNPSNDEDDNDFEDVDVNIEYDLALIKTLANGQSATVGLGDIVNYEITIANQGNVASNDYTVTDQIPAGMSFAAASDGGTAAGGIVTWNLSNLAPGATKVVTIALQVDDAAQSDYRNWAEISDDSASDYGVNDDDSTPNTNTGNDDTAGDGTAPDDPVDNHNDITLDNSSNDEDDNDFEDVTLSIEYDLALIKILAPGQATTVALNDIVEYEITIMNQGNVASNDFVVTDQIPAGMEFVSASDLGTAVGQVATWTKLSSLAPGQTKTVTISLRVTDVTLGDFRNWAEISEDSATDYGANVSDDDSTPDGNVGDDTTAGTGTDPNDPYTNHNDITQDQPANDEDDNDYEDVGVNVVYDLALIKTLSPSQSSVVAVGTQVDYEITVTNQGNVSSGNYDVSDFIPTGMSFISASDFGAPSGSVVTWSTLPNLAPGQSKVLRISLRLDDPTQSTYINIAEISDDSADDYGTTDEDSEPDTDPTDDLVDDHNDPAQDDAANDEDDNDIEAITVDIEYDLALIKELAAGQAAQVSVGDQVSYTITIMNQGNVPSNDYSVTDQIPAGMSFVNASDGGTMTAGVVTWSNLANIAAGNTKTLSITLSV